jgi:hypothetical protein
MTAPGNKTAGADLISLRRCLFLVQDFLQHFAQPAASAQHFAQVSPSLQQPPAHFMAVVGLEQEPSLQCAQPVVINIPAAKTAASIVNVFMFGMLLISWIRSYR